VGAGAAVASARAPSALGARDGADVASARAAYAVGPAVGRAVASSRAPWAEGRGVSDGAGDGGAEQPQASRQASNAKVVSPLAPHRGA